MIYKITWCEVKKTGNTNGRDWSITEMTLEDPDGNKTEKVSTFDPVMNGGTIEGTIVKNDKGYLNFKKLEAPDFIKRGNPNYKTDQINKAMDKKNESISHFQDKKEESIALAGAQRDAVLIVTSIFKDKNIDSDRELQEEIIKWRNWFLSDDFRIPPPFQ